MEFQIGQMWIKVTLKKAAMVIFPIGSHMVAINIDMYDEGMKTIGSSVSIGAEIYDRHNIVAASKVQKWMRELGD